MPQIKVTENFLLLPLPWRERTGCFILSCVGANLQNLASLFVPSVIPTMPPVAAQSRALCRFPLCRVGMPEGDWPKQLCKLGAGLPSPVGCDEVLCSGVLGDSKRCFQHFLGLSPPPAPVTLPIPRPGCREPASGSLCQGARNGSKHRKLGSQGQDGNELRGGTEEREKRGKRVSPLGLRQEGIASDTGRNSSRSESPLESLPGPLNMSCKRMKSGRL